MKIKHLAILMATLLVAACPLRVGTVFTIKSGPATLAIQSNAGGYGMVIQLTNRAAAYEQSNSMAVGVVDSGGTATWLQVPYSAVQDLGGDAFRCAGNITSSNGSVFSFTDTYQAYNGIGMFEVDRSVTVSSANAGDMGFSTRLALQRSVSGKMTDYDFFMPSVWYRTNTDVSQTALASTMTDNYYWYREDRLPLPLFMLRDKSNGATFAVIHQDPDGSTFAGEDGLSRIIDGRMQFASLGMEDNTQPLVGIVFPGTEGERTLIDGDSTNKNWALRSHPVTLGFTQNYHLVMRLMTEPDFPTAMEHVWMAAYQMFNPVIYNCNLNVIYSNAVQVLNRYWMNINSVPGEPFRVPWPSGIVTNQLDYNYQMGFVGMQLPNAAILIRAGFDTTNATLRAEGEQMVDWWANNSLTASGCLKTWYDPYPQTRRNYLTYTRVACDGMIGMLWAWNQEAKHGVAETNWLNACMQYGDWLIRQQHADGSIARAFDFTNNQPKDTSPSNTSHMVRYLTELYLATGLARYKHAALAAGNYIYTNVYQDFLYVGGTVDNPDVPDKEAASMALRAFTALCDLTQDGRWRDAAVQTAYYYATWIYAWNIPIPSGDPAVVYPQSRSTTGLSVIATANNGCDSYAATDAFEVCRLYLFTGDTNLLNEARMMLYNTKQPLDWDTANPLGYSDPGIFLESLTLLPPRGHGVGYYLPWQTANYLEPMIELDDTFCSCSINAIEQQPLAIRQAANQLFSDIRGYVLAQLILSATPGNGQVTLDWTPVTNAVSYLVQRATVSGGSYTTITNITGSSFTDTNVINEKTYYYVIVSVTSGGSRDGTSGEAFATPADGLAALYPFEGNTFDRSGADHNGVNVEAAFVPGVIGAQAVQFNGDSEVQIPCSIGSTNFTIALWAKTTDTGGTGANWYQGDGLVDAEVGGVTNDFGTSLLNGKFALGIGNPDTTLTTAKTINDGQWHHLTATWNITSGATQLYVDGTLNKSGTVPTWMRNAPSNIQIDHDPTGAYFKGTIDDVRLFNRVLTPSEIVSLASPPSAPIGLTATVSGGQVMLRWTGMPGTTSYNLKRSLTNGGPYDLIADGLISTNFVDANVAAGVTDYYVVSGVIGFYESTNSNVASVTPQGPPLLSAWISMGSNQLTLSWPGWSNDWMLYSSTNLKPPVIWTVVNNPVSSNNSRFYVNLPFFPGGQFFRLGSP